MIQLASCGLLFITTSLATMPFTAVPLGSGECAACYGTADADASAPDLACPGAYVMITVTVASAYCRIDGFPPYTVCMPNPCRASVTRKWAYLCSNTPMDFCFLTPAGQRYCLDTDPHTPGVQPPTSGPSGAGESTIVNPGVECGEGVYSFFVTGKCGDCPSGGSTTLSASADVQCLDHCS